MKIILIMMFLLLALNVYAADEWSKDDPGGSDNISDLDTIIGINNEAVDRLLANYREGAKLKYNSASSVTITTGEVVCSNSGGTVRRLRKNTSTISTTWSVAANGLDAGAEASSTTYYIYAVADADSENFTVFISTNSSTPTGATYYKRLGSFTNNSSSDIESIANDDENSIVSTGTIASGGTISLPSGYSQDECNWTVALGDGSSVNGASHPDGVYFVTTVTSSRVVTCTAGSVNTEADGTCTANYIIACYR